MHNSTWGKVTKAALAMALSVSMVWSSVPVTAFAEEVEAAQEPTAEAVAPEVTELEVETEEPVDEGEESKQVAEEEPVVDDALPEETAEEETDEAEVVSSEVEPNTDEAVTTDDAASAEEEATEEEQTDAESSDESKAEEEDKTSEEAKTEEEPKVEEETQAAPEEEMDEELAKAHDLQILDRDALTSAASGSVGTVYSQVFGNAANGTGVFRDNYNKSDKNSWYNSLWYTLFDLDLDGTPEFFVANGTYTYNMIIDVFTMRSGNAYHLGHVTGGVLYGNGKGELFVNRARMGLSQVYQIKKSGLKLTSTLVKSAEATSSDSSGTKQTDAYLKNKGTGKLETGRIISGSIKDDLMDRIGYAGYRFFPDVPSNHWAQKVISKACNWKMFSGYSNGKFGPSDTLTRGQIAVALWNDAYKPKAKSGAKNFSDVKAGTYYYNAIRWASSYGIVSGYRNGKFGPNDKVTREQMAVMIRNYVQKWHGLKANYGLQDYKKFSDASSVSPYARDAMGWCVNWGILSGSNGKLNPKGRATRAEAAKMMVKIYGYE